MGIETSTRNPGEVELRRREAAIRVPALFLFCSEGEPTKPSAEGDNESLLVFDPPWQQDRGRGALGSLAFQDTLPKEDLSCRLCDNYTRPSSPES